MKLRCRHMRRGWDEHPRTPDPMEGGVSKRAFDGKVKVWRRAIHKWDTSGHERSTFAGADEEMDYEDADCAPALSIVSDIVAASAPVVSFTVEQVDDVQVDYDEGELIPPTALGAITSNSTSSPGPVRTADHHSDEDDDDIL
jgi:hypothetical protein